mmetsp:Transcript_50719/g.108092  ORF Transcript_50719/g.108092 Transcript_50719/m.108092 type:complete len:239 (+) Transcript_50719:1682-2398(+)
MQYQSLEARLPQSPLVLVLQVLERLFPPGRYWPTAGRRLPPAVRGSGAASPTPIQYDGIERPSHLHARQRFVLHEVEDDLLQTEQGFAFSGVAQRREEGGVHLLQRIPRRRFGIRVGGGRCVIFGRGGGSRGRGGHRFRSVVHCPRGLSPTTWLHYRNPVIVPFLFLLQYYSGRTECSLLLENGRSISLLFRHGCSVDTLLSPSCIRSGALHYFRAGQRRRSGCHRVTPDDNYDLNRE